MVFKKKGSAGKYAVKQNYSQQGEYSVIKHIHEQPIELGKTYFIIYSQIKKSLNTKRAVAG